MFEIMTKKKDLIYLGIIAVGLIAHFVIIEEVKHKSSWCDQFFQEFRQGL